MVSLSAFAFITILTAVPLYQDSEQDDLGDTGELEDFSDLPDLTTLSLEELLQVEVISVSRKPQTVPTSPAAIYVLTEEDIRRSGHTSIPELLRMVPGLHVARINSSSWAISARGFNGRFNNKMLVMIDGRTVFSSLFSGVYWDVQDVHLADIERIEVIRGPGGTMWGANAVNGVINIITKSAADTQGQDYFTRVADEETIVSGRFGDRFGENGHWRAYAKWFDRDASVDPDGSDHPDDWGMLRGGFRADWAQGERDTFTVQGDVYDGRVRETFTVTEKVPGPDEVFRGSFDVQGGNLLGRWSRKLSEKSETELQVYYDLTERRAEVYDDKRETLDIDFQHRNILSEKHELIWGLGYRWITSEFKGSSGFDLDQSSRNDQLFSAFVQDEITLVEDAWTVIVGSKFEHNDYTGFEVQPSIRTLWMPAKDHVVWGAVSRAVRTPSVVQSDLIQTVAETTGPTSVVSTVLLGNDDLGADELMAYELGWRFRLDERTYIDLTAFYNDFSAADNFTVGPTNDLGGGAFEVPVFFDNSREATVVGGEVAIDFEVSERWKLRSGFSVLDLDFSGDVVGTPIQPQSDAEEPNFIGNLRSYWSIQDDLDLDIGLYAVDDLDDLDVGSYLRVDARLGLPAELGVRAGHRRTEHHGQSTRGVRDFPVVHRCGGGERHLLRPHLEALSAQLHAGAMASHAKTLRLERITRTFVRVSFCLIAGLALLGLTGFRGGANQKQVSPYLLKAAFLYNFALFTDWPKESFKDERAPLVVAVVGADPFGAALDKTFDKKKIKGRPVEIVRFKKIEDIGLCHILFVPAAEAPKIEAIQKRLGEQRVLVVGESKDFTLQGGSVNFYLKEKTIAFEVNPKAVKRAKLTISSRLLKLARIIEEKEKKDSKQGKGDEKSVKDKEGKQ